MKLDDFCGRLLVAANRNGDFEEADTALRKMGEELHSLVLRAGAHGVSLQELAQQHYNVLHTTDPISYPL